MQRPFGMMTSVFHLQLDSGDASKPFHTLEASSLKFFLLHSECLWGSCFPLLWRCNHVLIERLGAHQHCSSSPSHAFSPTELLGLSSSINTTCSDFLQDLVMYVSLMLVLGQAKLLGVLQFPPNLQNSVESHLLCEVQRR